MSASALLVTTALAAGRFDRVWLIALLLLVAVGQGATAATAWPAYRSGPHRFGALSPAAWRYLGFLAAVLFAAVEAHAVGAGWRAGAPAVSAGLLLPPVAVAAVALRAADALRGAEKNGEEERETGGETVGGTGGEKGGKEVSVEATEREGTR